jgi:hypothetical protein
LITITKKESFHEQAVEAYDDYWLAARCASATKKKEANQKERVDFKDTDEINDNQDDIDDEKRDREEQGKELHNNVWNEFAVNRKNDAPNLCRYLQAKDTRLRHRDTYELAISECMDALQELSAGILSDTSRLACVRLEKEVTSKEQHITTSLVTNHSRRKTCLNRMEVADRHWRKQYTLVTDNILSGVR